MKAFYRIWLGDAIADIGTSAYVFIIPILAVTYFGVSDSKLGIVVAIITAAPGLLAFPMGVLADRAPMALSLHGSNLVRALLMVLLVVLLVSGHLSLVSLVVIAFIVEALSLFYNLLISALIPRIVASEDLTRANSLVESAATATSSGGEFLGSFLYGKVGALWVFVLNAVSYVFSSLGVWLMQKVAPEAFSLPASEEQDPEKADSADSDDNAFDGSISSSAGNAVDSRDIDSTADPVEQQQLGLSATASRRIANSVAQMRENVRLWVKLPSVVVLTMNAMCFNLAIGFIVTLLVPYALDEVGVSVGVLGLLSLPGVLLGLAAPLVVPFLEKQLGVWGTIVLATVGAGVSVGIIWSASQVQPLVGGFVLACGLAVLDFSALVALIIDRSYRQRLVPDDRQAGISGLIQTITWGCDPFASLLAGALSAYVLGRQTTIAFAVVFALLGLLIVVFSKKYFLWVSG